MLRLGLMILLVGVLVTAPVGMRSMGSATPPGPLRTLERVLAAYDSYPQRVELTGVVYVDTDHREGNSAQDLAYRLAGRLGWDTAELVWYPASGASRSELKTPDNRRRIAVGPAARASDPAAPGGDEWLVIVHAVWADLPDAGALPTIAQTRSRLQNTLAELNPDVALYTVIAASLPDPGSAAGREQLGRDLLGRLTAGHVVAVHGEDLVSLTGWSASLPRPPWSRPDQSGPTINVQVSLRPPAAGSDGIAVWLGHPLINVAR